MPTARTAYGITYYAYSLHDWRRLRTPHDIPRDHWPILQRTGNYEPRNRIDHRVGAIPQRGGVDHIGAGFQDNNPVDLGAERLTEYGLNPANTRASWHGAVDSNSICLLAPPDTRPWVHGVTNSLGVDMNSAALGIEDGILSPNWDALPEPKRTAHYRMRAAWWALWMGYLGWPLIYTPDRTRVLQLASRGESWGLTQHADLDPGNRSDAGYVYRNGRRVNTFDYDLLFRMIQEEQAIRASGQVATPTPAPPNEDVKTVQRFLNDLGNNLDVDGYFGSLTQAAATEYAADYGYTGRVTDLAALNTSLEDTMSKIDTLLAEVRTLRSHVNEIRYATRRVSLSEADRQMLATALTTITPAGLAKVSALQAAAARRAAAADGPEQRAHVSAEADRVIAAITEEDDA